MDHLQEEGFAVQSADVPQAQLIAVKNNHGVPPRLRSCHTGLVEDYVIEGHVPGNLISRLLKERPDVMETAKIWGGVRFRRSGLFLSD